MDDLGPFFSDAVFPLFYFKFKIKSKIIISNDHNNQKYYGNSDSAMERNLLHQSFLEYNQILLFLLLFFSRCS